MKDTLLFAEGFIGSAGSMVSDTAIGAVDLTQIIGIASIDGVNRLTGGQTPEWMKRDLQGTADNLSSLAELGVGTYTALTDPGAAMRGQDPNASYADKAAYRAQQTGKALWDKVTHMDAYDAGGLTFEIASLFVGPAAVGKMAKGTKLGAKAAEMIQLAKNSTKAKILANVEKWGSKVDNILAKSNNVIGKFGEKLLDSRIPVGIRKEAVAFAGGMGTMPTFSVESKTLREVRQFFSKHADDVAKEKTFLQDMAGMSSTTTPLSNAPYIKNGKPNGRPGPTGKKKLEFEKAVYDAQVDPDGVLRDLNTGEIIEWKPGQPRKGAVDFGHEKGKSYKEMFEKYKNREITLDELKEFQSNPDNFRLETPSANRSHKYE